MKFIAHSDQFDNTDNEVHYKCVSNNKTKKKMASFTGLDTFFLLSLAFGSHAHTRPLCTANISKLKTANQKFHILKEGKEKTLKRSLSDSQLINYLIIALSPPSSPPQLTAKIRNDSENEHFNQRTIIYGFHRIILIITTTTKGNERELDNGHVLIGAKAFNEFALCRTNQCAHRMILFTVFYYSTRWSSLTKSVQHTDNNWS